MVFHGEKIPHAPDEGERGKILKVNAFIVVARMIRADINTGFFHIQRNEFQLFVGQNMLELVQLFFCDIDNPDLGKSLGNPVADLFHGAF